MVFKKLTLLSLVAHLPGLGRPGRRDSPVDGRQVPVVPGPDPEDVLHGVGLLLPP